MEILVQSPAGSEPLGLQWDLRLPLSQMDLDGNGIELGEAAKQAGKTLHCAPRKSEAGVHDSICFISGGQQPVRNGTVARVNLRVAPDLPPGAARIRIQKGLAVNRALKGVTIPDAETSVTIRGK